MITQQIPFLRAANQTIAHRAQVDYVVVHTMELPCRQGIAHRLAVRFGEGDRKVSAHYCIDPGSVVQCVREENVAWHCPGANRRGIGIEHAGYAFPGDDHEATDWGSPDGQDVMRLSAELVAGICRRWGIPVQKLAPSEIVHGRGIIGHDDASKAFATPGGHRDPGPRWPWGAYIAMVAEALAAIRP